MRVKVYVVMVGCYSSRRVAAVTLDEEKAHLISDRLEEGDVSDVEEFDTDRVDDAYEAYKLGYVQYFVGFNENDNIYCVYKDNNVNQEKEEHNICADTYIVWAKDEETAKRIAIDRHAMWKAQQEGIS